MNDEAVEMRLLSIEKKLDAVTELITKSSLLEYRTVKLEDSLLRVQERIDGIIRRGSDVRWRFLTPAISAGISALVGFVISGGLLGGK